MSESEGALGSWAAGFFLAGLLSLVWIRLRRGKAGDPIPRGAPPVLTRGLTAAFVLFFAYILAAAVGGALLVKSGAAARDHRTVLLLDGAAKVVALLTAWAVFRSKEGARDPGPARSIPSVLAGLLAGIAFLPLMLLASLLQERVARALDWKPAPQDLVEFAKKGTDIDFHLVVLFAVILAPLFEEMVFRVFFYSGLRARTGPVPAALLSAALFALVHLQPVTFPVTFLLGLCLAWIRERTGGRSAPIAMHACYNTVQMAGILALRAGVAGPTGG